ncbi:MAG: hypothetical protein KKB51_02835 [Candidatus Riflebacteria bacterium]|nr:hypothetical protein [Candidatus Riflebacteria bacterium]
MKYSITDQSWFIQNESERTVLELSFFFLSPKSYKEIIQNSEAFNATKKDGREYMYIYPTEVWMKNSIPLEKVDEILHVTVINSKKNWSPWFRAMHDATLPEGI